MVSRARGGRGIRRATMLPLVSIAEAHAPGLSSLRIDADRVTLTFARGEVEGFTPFADIDASRLLIVDATLARATLSASGLPCTLGEAAVSAAESDGVAVSASYTCEAAGPLTWHAGYLAAMAAGHRQYVEVDGVPAGMLTAASPDLTVRAVPTTGAVVAEFVELGVHHIWTGYDHLTFLAGLLLAAGGLRDMLFVVTGFTIAHSITLSLAATGLFTLPPSWVEPGIAASIVFVGVENLFRPPIRRRVALTFLLGLVHGFGFAGLLSELGLPQGHLAVALLSFNGGVELGQGAIVLAVLPVMLRLARWPVWRSRGVPALSTAIALAGAFWLVQRVAALAG